MEKNIQKKLEERWVREQRIGVLIVNARSVKGTLREELGTVQLVTGVNNILILRKGYLEGEKPSGYFR